mmetsp:Transcript_7751/g.31402  ORF Transcript_7751/g.31402 Transcript_7751/m.31402 type:complete len:252 (+) Transcript_7751:2638-3393(+)
MLILNHIVGEAHLLQKLLILRLGQHRVPPALAPLHHHEFSVSGVTKFVEHVAGPLVPPHQENSQGQPVSDNQHGAVLRVSAKVHVVSERLPEAGHAIVHVRGALSVGKAVEEPPEPVPLFLELLHSVVLKVPKVLLAHPRLLPHAADSLWSQGLTEFVQRLHRPHVRRHVHVNLLVGIQKLLQSQPCLPRLFLPPLGQFNPVVRFALIHGLVHVPLGLGVANEDDALRAAGNLDWHTAVLGRHVIEGVRLG